MTTDEVRAVVRARAGVEPADQRGFTLIELVVAAGVITLAIAATAGGFAALARNAAPGGVRDAALTAGENALVRARAAAAYVPAPAADGSTPPPDRSWALVPGTTTYLAGARIAGGSACASATLSLPVSATFDPEAQTFTAVVTYPRDPCAVTPGGAIPPADAATVTLQETLPPPAYAPGTAVVRDVATPARL